jgi:hypothetical protein
MRSPRCTSDTSWSIPRKDGLTRPPSSAAPALAVPPCNCDCDEARVTVCPLPGTRSGHARKPARARRWAIAASGPPAARRPRHIGRCTARILWTINIKIQNAIVTRITCLAQSTCGSCDENKVLAAVPAPSAIGAIWALHEMPTAQACISACWAR